jgi:hypothetical protein
MGDIMNPKSNPVKVDGVIYGVVWQDFGTFNRLNVYENDKKVGHRDLPIAIDQDLNIIRYVVRKMKGSCGPLGLLIKRG